jgi:hypothetical protein
LNWWLRHRLANQVKTRLQLRSPRLDPLLWVGHHSRSALAQSHGSDLLPLRLPFARRPALPFVASPALRKVFTEPAQLACPPQSRRSLCPAFRRLWLGQPRSRGTARAVWPVLDTVATPYPLGNCDSHRPETRRRYFTRLGTASYRSWPPSPYFALLTARERRQRNW